MSLDCIGAYNDTVLELKILELREEEVRKRVEIAHKVIEKGKAQSSGREFCHVPLDKAIEVFNRECDELREIQEKVDRKRELVQHMNMLMAKFTGLAYIIQYKHMVEGKTYRQIGAEINMTEQSIKNHMHRKRNRLSTESANVS